MNKQNHFDVWDYYFSSGYSYEDYEILRLHALHECTQFMRGMAEGHIKVNDDLTPRSSYPHLDHWVQQNDALLSNLVTDIQTHIFSAVRFALPAHDERQILFKDAAEGLRFHQIEKPQGYKSTFVIPMFAHDIGRLLEGRLFDPQQNPHDKWIPHSQLSFLLFNNILDQPQYRDMPRELKNHFLYAVLAHSGDNGKSYMSRAVQTCDRMQLIGAEGLFRDMFYNICLMEGDIKYPDEPSYQYNLPDMYDNRSVLSMLEYCARNMRENIGDHYAAWQRRIAVENMTLLKVAAEGNPDLQRRIFAPELELGDNFGPQKGRIASDIMRDADRYYQSFQGQDDGIYSRFEVSSALISAIERPVGAAQLTEDMKSSLRHAVGNMSDIERKALYRMISIANIIRIEQDGIDKQLALHLTNDSQHFVRAIAAVAHPYGGQDISAVPGADVGLHTSVSPFAAFQPF